MRDQNICPICWSARCKIIYRFNIHDHYKKPETKLHKSNTYHRNFILFNTILNHYVEKIEVKFKLCKNCGFIFFSPRPDEQALEIKYRLVGEQKDTLTREQIRRLIDLRALRANRIYSLLKGHWKRNVGRALDIGGADGHCLGRFTSKFDCGIVDFENRTLWPGLKKWGDRIEDLKSDELFDMIITCHTLEHIPDVPSFLKKIMYHLPEEGILYIEVPYGCAGEIHKTSNILTHLNFFSEGSLGFLLEKVGLHVVHMASLPALSSNRYLPVIIAIAKKDNSCPVKGYYLKNSFAITQRQMLCGISGAVFMANIKLVLSHPFQYALAYIGRLINIFFLKYGKNI